MSTTSVAIFFALIGVRGGGLVGGAVAEEVGDEHAVAQGKRSGRSGGASRGMTRGSHGGRGWGECERRSTWFEDEGTLKALLFSGKAMCAMAKGGG
jgi:hypothetical protein